MAIEWPERLPVKPDRYLQIDLSHREAQGRQVNLQWYGQPGIALENLIKTMGESNSN